MTYLGPTIEYRRYPAARRPEEYVGQPGPHFGLALPPSAYEAIAEAKVTGNPNQYAVVGEWHRSDGARFLDLAVTREWIEATTLFRADERGQLRWTCPDCGKRGGGHTRACEFE